jgi:hypothetical protein
MLRLVISIIMISALLINLLVAGLPVNAGMVGAACGATAVLLMRLEKQKVSNSGL